MQQAPVDPEWGNFFHPIAEKSETLVECLARLPLFSLLDEDELAQVARSVHVRFFVAGERVVRGGRQQSGFYLIRSGSVDIVSHDAAGDPLVEGTLSRGELISEFALVDEAPQSYSLVATDNSELVGFFKPDLMDILEIRPALGCKILLRLTERMCGSLVAAYGSLRQMGYSHHEPTCDRVMV